MSAIDTAARERTDLWPLEQALEYQPRPAIPCRCPLPILERWDRGPVAYRCVRCGHDRGAVAR